MFVVHAPLKSDHPIDFVTGDSEATLIVDLCHQYPSVRHQAETYP